MEPMLKSEIQRGSDVTQAVAMLRAVPRIRSLRLQWEGNVHKNLLGLLLPRLGMELADQPRATWE
jgi:hypothetical protein